MQKGRWTERLRGRTVARNAEEEDGTLKQQILQVGHIQYMALRRRKSRVVEKSGTSLFLYLCQSVPVKLFISEHKY